MGQAKAEENKVYALASLDVIVCWISFAPAGPGQKKQLTEWIGKAAGTTWWLCGLMVQQPMVKTQDWLDH